jgi:hypothetical protein
MNELLTDDEIVALSVNVGKAWPLSLPTIPTKDLPNLQASNNRGIRSLAVRGLATVAPQDGLTMDHGLLDLASRAIGASEYLAAYVANQESPGVPAGSSVTVYFAQGGGPAVVDSVTVSGVHALRAESPADGRAAVEGFAENAFRGKTLTATPGLVVVVATVTTGSFDVPAVVISEGSVQIGALAFKNSPNGQFSPSETSSEWDPQVLSSGG